MEKRDILLPGTFFRKRNLSDTIKIFLLIKKTCRTWGNKSLTEITYKHFIKEAEIVNSFLLGSLWTQWIWWIYLPSCHTLSPSSLITCLSSTSLGRLEKFCVSSELPGEKPISKVVLDWPEDINHLRRKIDIFCKLSTFL